MSLNCGSTKRKSLQTLSPVWAIWITAYMQEQVLNICLVIRKLPLRITPQWQVSLFSVFLSTKNFKANKWPFLILILFISRHNLKIVTCMAFLFIWLAVNLSVFLRVFLCVFQCLSMSLWLFFPMRLSACLPMCLCQNYQKFPSQWEFPATVDTRPFSPPY